MKRRLGPLALVALLGSACGEPRLLEGFSEGQTRIRLQPSAFVGAVPCRRDLPGALHSYVAVVEEVNPNEPLDAGYYTTAFETGSAACDQAVLFPAVDGRLYSARIYGFDRDDVSGADLSSASWTALCGHGRLGSIPSDAGPDPNQPTAAERGYTVPLRGCTTFSGESGTPQPRAQLSVDTASALGGLRCGSGPGEVYAFRGTLDGVTRSALCGQPLVFDVPVADRYYTIALTGLAASADAGSGDAGVSDGGAAPPAAPGAPSDAGVDASVGDALDASAGQPSPADAGNAPAPDGIPRWQTSCVGRALDGVTAAAVCDPLRDLP